MITKEKKEELAKVLNSKISKLECPMCHQHDFIIADGFFNNSLQDTYQGLGIGGQAIPSIAIICTHCGFISQHALGVLGMLPKKDDNNDKQKNEDNGKTE